MRYLPDILNNISEDKEILCNLYFDFLNNNKIDGLELEFKSLVPELEIVSQNVNDRRDYIVYGAGNYGIEVSNKYKQKVKFFADRNKAKHLLYLISQKNDLIQEYSENLKYLYRLHKQFIKFYYKLLTKNGK